MTNIGAKTLLVLLSGLIILSVGLSYQRTIVKRDFETFNSEAEIVENELQTEESVEEPAVETGTSTDSEIL